VTLKLVIKESDYRTEVGALRAFPRHITVPFLDHSPTEQAILLDRVTPGVPLSSLVRNGRDEIATHISGVVMKYLRMTSARSVAADFPDLAAEALEALTAYRQAHPYEPGPMPRGALDRAEALIKELDATASAKIILHADLHHDNIMTSNRRAWLAIDPKGRSGDPASETAAHIRNPIDYLVALPNLRSVLKRRVDQLSEQLGHDRERITGWAISLARVAACWQLEDREPGYSKWLLIAEALE
jgi:streptomycin 6-kinase